MSTPPPRWVFIIGGFAVQLVVMALTVSAWGDWRGFFSHPARLGFVVGVFAFTLAASVSGMSFGSGQREDRRDRRIFLPAIVGTVLLTWLLPFSDGRDILVLDGDAVRYTGLVLFLIGGVLRVWPMFILGKRFSPFVAIQPGHHLVTEGPYGTIRHPSYVGALLAEAGWILIFRSALGLALLPPSVALLTRRMNAEEALLESEFGAQYATYRQRTSRLIPFVY